MNLESFRYLFLFLFLLGFSVFNVGCYEHRRGEVVIETHDARWHYDHDHDDNWRQSHPWREGGY